MSAGAPSIVDATTSYESWLGGHTELIAGDIDAKHRLMAQAVFPFLRATAYRWAQRWPDVCRELTSAPRVLAIGDLHVENFGTWRDAEGRLVWGINDVDEAVTFPYTSDLVRLVASAVIATREAHLSVTADEAAAAALDGYGSALSAGGRPYVLAEAHAGLRALAIGSLKDPVRYWQKLRSLPPTSHNDGVAAARAALPAGALEVCDGARVAGAGSLGRVRVVATAEWGGALIAREAKALAPSAWLWALSSSATSLGAQAARMRRLADGRGRAGDPFWRAQRSWLIRRLAPDCSRIELTDLPSDRDERRLLRAMGGETANAHLLTAGVGPAILADLNTRPAQWLSGAAQSMADDTAADQSAWASHAQI